MCLKLLSSIDATNGLYVECTLCIAEAVWQKRTSVEGNEHVLLEDADTGCTCSFFDTLGVLVEGLFEFFHALWTRLSCEAHRLVEQERLQNRVHAEREDREERLRDEEGHQSNEDANDEWLSH